MVHSVYSTRLLCGFSPLSIGYIIIPCAHMRRHSPNEMPRGIVPVWVRKDTATKDRILSFGAPSFRWPLWINHFALRQSRTLRIISRLRIFLSRMMTFWLAWGLLFVSHQDIFVSHEGIFFSHQSTSTIMKGGKKKSPFWSRLITFWSRMRISCFASTHFCLAWTIGYWEGQD